MTELEISTAISAHKHWKTRLSLLLGDLHKEPLDPLEVGDPTRCELGKWITSVSAATDTDVLLQSLIKTHAEFHHLASAIVALANDGKNEQAKHLLNNEFAELSADVVDLLNEIALRRRAKNPSA